MDKSMRIIACSSYLCSSDFAAAMAGRRSLPMGTTCIAATTSSHWSRPRSNAEEDSPVKDRISITMLDGGIADVRLFRTDKMNALDPAMWEALAEAVDQLKAMAGLRVVVLSGEGRAFCAGLEIGRAHV